MKSYLVLTKMDLSQDVDLYGPYLDYQEARKIYEALKPELESNYVGDIDWRVLHEDGLTLQEGLGSPHDWIWVALVEREDANDAYCFSVESGL